LNLRVWKLILVLIATAVAVSSFSCASVRAQITNGSISASFPNDFPTALTAPNIVSSIYSSGTTSYLLDGQSVPLNVEFESYNGNGVGSSTGEITIIASSDAFVSAVSQTLDINETYQFFTFALNPTIKSGIDGTYTVNYVALNALSNQVTESQDTINIWSPTHVDAADSLYSASSLLYTYYYGITLYQGNTFQSPQAKANQTLAILEYASANIAYENKDWNGTEAHAQNSINLMEEADAAETASDLQGKTTYLVQITTYPLLIITILIMFYIIAATYRKIYPSTKTAKPARENTFAKYDSNEQE